MLRRRRHNRVPLTAALASGRLRTETQRTSGKLLLVTESCTQVPGTISNQSASLHGSFRHDEERGCQSGYAVDICKLADVADPSFDVASAKCVILTGTVPVSGANYTEQALP